MWSESRGCNSCETETKISQTSARVEPALIVLVANEEFSFLSVTQSEITWSDLWQK